MIPFLCRSLDIFCEKSHDHAGHGHAVPEIMGNGMFLAFLVVSIGFLILMDRRRPRH